MSTGTVDPSTTDLADTLMNAALDLCLAAAAMEVVPALGARYLFSLSQGNSTNINGAAVEWAAAATKVSEAATVLRRAASGVSPEDWTAGDREKYDEAVDRACRQLGDVYEFFDSTSQVLAVAALALVLYDTFAIAIAAILVSIGVAIVGSEAGVVTAVDVPGLLAYAAVMLDVTVVATAALAAVGTMVGTALQAAALAGARAESHDGDAQAWGDLKDGEEIGAAAAAANLAQDVLNAGIDYASRGTGVAGRRKSLGLSGKNLTGRRGDVVDVKGKKESDRYDSGAGVVDLDADRSWNETWNVGGGAQVGNVSGSAHAEFGDGRLQGVSGSASYQADTGGQASLSGSESVDGHGERHDHVAASAGYQGSAGSAGVTVTGHQDVGQDGNVSRGHSVNGYAKDRYGTPLSDYLPDGRDPDGKGRD